MDRIDAWVRRAELVVERFVAEPEESDEPTCGPGPFSMGDADVTSEILLGAGFEEVSLRRCDLPIQTGRDLDEAVEFAMALGPAGEVIRLAGAEAERIRPEIAAALRESWPSSSTRTGSGRRPRPGSSAPGHRQWAKISMHRAGRRDSVGNRRTRRRGRN